MGQLPALRRDVRRRGARTEARAEGRSRSLRGDPRGEEARPRSTQRLGAAGRRAPGARGRVQGGDRASHPRRVPGRSDGAAPGGDRGGVPVLGQRPRGRLPQAPQRPVGVGHRRDRPVDGLREHGRGLRHGRGVHPQPRDGHERVLRRVPGERAGRGRRGGHPHAPAHLRARGALARDRAAARRRAVPAGAALPRHAGHRVHHRAGAAVRAADPLRQAHRPRRRPHRGGHGRRQAHPEGGRDPARRARGAEPPAPAGVRSGEEGGRGEGREAPREGAPRRSGRGERAARVLRGGRRGVAGAGRDGAARASRDLARGHPRHGGGRRVPHRVRRNDLARGARGATDGQGRHRRLRGPPLRLSRAQDDRRDRLGRAHLRRGRRGSRSTAPRAR